MKLKTTKKIESMMKISPQHGNNNVIKIKLTQLVKYIMIDAIKAQLWKYFLLYGVGRG